MGAFSGEITVEFLKRKLLSHVRLTLKGKNLLLLEQILSFKCRLPFVRLYPQENK